MENDRPLTQTLVSNLYIYGLVQERRTLVSQIVEHTEEHLEEIAENLIVEHLFYTVSIATNNRTPGIFPLR